MKQIDVELGERSYPVWVGPGLLDQVGELFERLSIRTSSALFIITDQNVESKGYLRQVCDSLTKAGFTVSSEVIPAGESSKSLEQASLLLQACLKAGLDRKSTMIAVGGGVVGDLAGFVAATYMRGIDFVQIPTTILAHDAAVGGKVAVNLPQAKNIVGSFHQPRAVIYDTQTLTTLPLREIRSGLAEGIKHALLSGEDFAQMVESKVEQLLQVDQSAMIDLLSRGIQVKADIVSKDERESHIRAYLNLGHTLGHAIEAAAGYGQFSHGEAISIGMNFAYYLAVQLGYTTESVWTRVHRIFTMYGLPTALPTDLDVDVLISKMFEDKKTVGKDLTFVLPRQLGEVEIVKGIDVQVIRDLLQRSKEWQ